MPRVNEESEWRIVAEAKRFPTDHCFLCLKHTRQRKRDFIDSFRSVDRSDSIITCVRASNTTNTFSPEDMRQAGLAALAAWRQTARRPALSRRFPLQPSKGENLCGLSRLEQWVEHSLIKLQSDGQVMVELVCTG